MPPPTLLKKGSLVSNIADVEKQANLDTMVPIDYIMNWFKQRMNAPVSVKNRLLVLKSDTGSGKSTAFPATLFSTFFKKGGGGIACAQPRVLNAVSIVRDLTTSGFYKFFKLGENIGWQTGPTKKEAKVGLTFMTIGVLVMQLKTLPDDVFMQKYKFIIVDEVHEASLDQATLIYMLRNFMIRNANNVHLPFVILTSATFDTNKFLKYFGVYDAPIQPNLIQVAGFTYPLIDKWTLSEPTPNYIETIGKTVATIHIENSTDDPSSADILIFLPGMAEIERVYETLVETNKRLATDGKPVFMPLVVVSETVSENKPDYAAVFAPVNSLEVTIGDTRMKPTRRVILSTNVAETGVTIETLRYVIDSGFNRTPEFNPNFNTHAIITKCATKSMIRQRMGRANRKNVGVFYPMYPRALFDKLEDISLSHIETSDTTSHQLILMYEQIKRVYNENKLRGVEHSLNNPEISTHNIDLLDMLPLDSISAGLETLYSIGFISPASTYKYIELTNDIVLDRAKLIRDTTNPTPTYNLTKLGALAISFSRVDPRSIRMILAAYSWGVSILDMITVAAWLQFEISEFTETPTNPPDFIGTYRDALPITFTHEIVGHNSTFRIKLLIADDFITGLFIWRSLMKVVNLNSGPELYDQIGIWCKNRRFKQKTIMSMLTARDEIIENMISIGLNPFIGTNLFDQPEELLIDTITKMKYCIADGYKNNLAVFDETVGGYVTQQGLRLKTPAIFSQDEIKLAEVKKYGIESTVKPKYILYDKITLKMDRKTQLYNASIGRAASLDGYINL